MIAYSCYQRMLHPEASGKSDGSCWVSDLLCMTLKRIWVRMNLPMPNTSTQLFRSLSLSVTHLEEVSSPVPWGSTNGNHIGKYKWNLELEGIYKLVCWWHCEGPSLTMTVQGHIHEKKVRNTLGHHAKACLRDWKLAASSHSTSHTHGSFSPKGIFIFKNRLSTLSIWEISYKNVDVHFY